jgi:formylglycine-generating enzyme required for sulfatase activity
MKVFISYSRKDKKWLERLRPHLKQLELEGKIEVWTDNKISIGDNWQDKISEALETSSSAILLVSQHFLASEFIANNELPPILNASQRKGNLIIPIIVNFCRFEKSPLSQFQTANNPRKPLNTLQNFEQNKIFNNVVDRLEKEADRLEKDPYTGGSEEVLTKKKSHTSILLPKTVEIEPGEFWMGSPLEEQGRYSDEDLHEVKIKYPFAIGQWPVTFDEYDVFASDLNYGKPNDEDWGRGQRPVINVSWFEAVQYARWLSDYTGQKYRLPTEAEWEYMARAGSDTPYQFGSTIQPGQANFGNRHGKTLEVADGDSNSWGIYDIHGNVWEWTCSEYSKHYCGLEEECDKRIDSTPRVARGGSWSNDNQRDLRFAVRKAEKPYIRKNVLGFRLVLEL